MRPNCKLEERLQGLREERATSPMSYWSEWWRTCDRLRNAVFAAVSRDSLKGKALKGGAWMGGGSVVEQVLRFARNILLARVLAPADFGAMAIVLSVSSLLTSLSDVGMVPAVVQNPRGGEDAYLNAAWWIGMCRALCVYGVIFLAAPWIGRFYGGVELPALLRVSVLGTVFDAMMSPRAKLAQKEMRFGKLALFMNGGAICGVLVTVALSLALRSVWGLAIGYCSESCFRCLFSYILYPGLSTLGWERHAFLELLRFSKGMIGLSFLNLVFARSDIFVIGKLYSHDQLGIYSMGVNLLLTPACFLITVLSSTLMPILASVQKDGERMRRIVLAGTSWIIVLGLPAIVAVGLCGSSLLTIAYGKQYAAAAGALAVAACVVFINVLNVIFTTLFFSIGRPELHRRAVALSAVIMLVTIYPAVHWLGIVGGQIAALGAILGGYLLQVSRARKIVGRGIVRYAPVAIPVLVAVSLIVFAIVTAKSLGLAATPQRSISVALVACMVGYGVCLPTLAKFWDYR
jgi:O-antigen/teichoic acid export membrane protein